MDTNGNINKLFIPYELALLSKEKGFDEPCFAGWLSNGEFAEPDNELNVFRNRNRSGGEISAPTHQQLTDWLDNKGIFINATHEKIGYTNEEDSTPLTVLKWEYHITKIDALSTYNFSHIKAECNFKTKREALNKAIEEALKLI